MVLYGIKGNKLSYSTALYISKYNMNCYGILVFCIA